VSAWAWKSSELVKRFIESPSVFLACCDGLRERGSGTQGRPWRAIVEVKPGN